MSDVIYKFGPFGTNNVVEYAGVPVYVGYQDQIYSPHPDHQIFMWCRLSDDGSGGKAKIVATGEKFTGRYHGTVVMPSSMVWHVIEVEE